MSQLRINLKKRNRLLLTTRTNRRTDALAKDSLKQFLTSPPVDQSLLDTAGNCDNEQTKLSVAEYNNWNTHNNTFGDYSEKFKYSLKHLDEIQDRSTVSEQNIFEAYLHDNNPTCDLENQNHNSGTPDLIPLDDTNNKFFPEFGSINLGKKSLDDHNFNDDLVKWALTHKIPQTVLTILLHIIRKHVPTCGLPADARTLLATPRQANTVDMPPGKFFYYGLTPGINDFLQNEWDKEALNLRIQVSTDGLPIANSGGGQLWPLMGRITVSTTVFLIGCYWGRSKPLNSNDYFRDFVRDITTLIQDGFTFEGRTLSLAMHCLICDIPAKSFSLMTKGHAGYNSCPKCTIHGKYVDNRVIFDEVDCPERTDWSLFNQEDDDFQRGRSILLEIPGFGLVSGIPMDPMHALCEGVVKRLLQLWDKGPITVRLLTKRNSSLCTEYLKLLAIYLPRDFGRKITTMENNGHWKANQYRLFLLYIGVVLLRRILPENDKLLIHFRKLFIAARLLSVGKNVEYAKNSMREFVIEFSCLYGKMNATTCVHALTHLADDVSNLGPLDTFSAFPYENFLRHIKRTSHSTKTPLEQLSNTYAAMLKFGVGFCTKPNGSVKGPLYSHADGPLVFGNTQSQYSSFNFEDFTLTTEVPDNCCMINDDVILVENFVKMANGSELIVGRKFLSLTNLFTEPCPSFEVGTFRAKSLSSLNVWSVQSKVIKCVCLPLHDRKNEFAVLCLLHTMMCSEEDAN